MLRKKVLNLVFVYFSCGEVKHANIIISRALSKPPVRKGKGESGEYTHISHHKLEHYIKLGVDRLYKVNCKSVTKYLYLWSRSPAHTLLQH